jgi:hypothetical protein
VLSLTKPSDSSTKKSKVLMAFCQKGIPMSELQGLYQRGQLHEKIQTIIQEFPTGRVMLRSGQRLATLFIAESNIVDAVIGTKKGLVAFQELLGWADGEFRFSPGMLSQTPSLELALEDLKHAGNAPVSVAPVAPAPVAPVAPAQSSKLSDTWSDAQPSMMAGNLGSVDIVNLLRVLCNLGQAGVLRLRPKDEARVYIADGTVTHAAFGQLRGMQALSEIATWKNDIFRFETGLTSQEINIALPLSQILGKMTDVIETKTLSSSQSAGVMYFYSSPVPQQIKLNPLALELVTHADGNSFEELVALTKSSNDLVAVQLKNLLDLNLVRTEFSPSTPKVLRSIKPQHTESKGFFAAKPKLKLEQLTRLELSVYDQIDGGRTLWDIRVNLGISRQDVWAAYQRLLEGGLAVGRSA